MGKDKKDKKDKDKKPKDKKEKKSKKARASSSDSSASDSGAVAAVADRVVVPVARPVGIPVINIGIPLVNMPIAPVTAVAIAPSAGAGAAAAANRFGAPLTVTPVGVSLAPRPQMNLDAATGLLAEPGPPAVRRPPLAAPRSLSPPRYLVDLMDRAMQQHRASQQA